MVVNSSIMPRARKARPSRPDVGDVVVFPFGLRPSIGRVVESRSTGPGGLDLLGVKVRTGVRNQVIRFEISAEGATRVNGPPERPSRTAATPMPPRVRRRLLQGRFKSGNDFATVRRFVGLSRPELARVTGVPVHAVRSYEQGRRWPERSFLRLLHIAARHPRVIRAYVRPAA
jgi:DNA-binding transcriptional regulator YiaG